MKLMPFLFFGSEWACYQRDGKKTYASVKNEPINIIRTRHLGVGLYVITGYAFTTVNVLYAALLHIIASRYTKNRRTSIEIGRAHV